MNELKSTAALLSFMLFQLDSKNYYMDEFEMALKSKQLLTSMITQITNQIKESENEIKNETESDSNVNVSNP